MSLFSYPPIVTKINKNFVIRVTRPNGNTTLKGAGMYSTLVGSRLAKKHFSKVLNGTLHTYTFKLRRGLTIKFVSK